jgi:DNA mismatch repair ATPase MutS
MPDAERAAEIMQRARATLERLEQADLERACERALCGPVEPDYGEDSMQRWERLRKQSAEPAKVPKPKENRVTQDTVTRAEMCAHIQQAIEEAISIVGEESGMNEKQLRDELATLRAEVGAMRDEVAELRGDVQREPIDLPAFRLIGGNRA